MQLPEKIQNMISGESYQIDEIGESGSSIRLFEDKVLKIQKSSREADGEYRMMTWLHDKLPVPRVFAHETLNNHTFLLMTKIDGRMACEEEYMKNLPMQVRLLSSGLKMLWDVDISDCPVNWNLTHKLEQARYNVENGLVDLDNVEPDTFGEDGFESPEALLQWLYENQPEEEPTLSHGDYCLPNIFGVEDEISGFIDLGRTGIADKWCDIALCYRSLSHNYSGRYDGRAYPGYDEQLLFKELEIEPDWEKIRYYTLLDELF